ncbi:conserved hypothetical protein [Carnobacterium maltaromaticum]|uniref:Uncharacterized protein n=1 Tax=Carnobacterium maltaromaticum TaxID=2751 RepID=A0AAW9K534_CARML|nr:hypothetical protein [Carnobacterium maltaromaticum]MDZ5759685.1 hypothetical protein [Carnobacterium maltaromaticum]CAD5896722.1 conserved hypothetical protein [Carnobacterium maltaromaticum]
MSIEDYWDDVIVYSVHFTTKELNERKICKILIFPCEYTTVEIEAAVFENFNNIKEINLIVEYTEGMLLKK